MTSIATILPASRLSIAELQNTLTQLPHGFEPLLVVFNDSDETMAQYLHQLAEACRIQLLAIPYQVGKAEALRQGLKQVLERSDAEIIVQFDGRSKQPLWQLTPLVSAMQQNGADMAIGDRYAKQDMEGQSHRTAGAGLMSLLIRYVTGYELRDAVCGVRAYVRQLGVQFLGLHCYGYGVEAEQLLIAAVHHSPVLSFPLEASRQADATNAEKIEDNLLALLSYANEFDISNEARTYLSFMLTQVKRRTTFEIDLSVFNGRGRARLNYVGGQGDIVDAYTDQSIRDAYVAARA